MIHSKPLCLTPISTTTEEWWPTSLCLGVGSEKGTGSRRHISAKPMRSTSWGSSGQMNTQHRRCTWHPSTSTHSSNCYYNYKMPSVLFLDVKLAWLIVNGISLNAGKISLAFSPIVTFLKTIVKLFLANWISNDFLFRVNLMRTTLFFTQSFFIEFINICERFSTGWSLQESTSTAAGFNVFKWA